MEYKGRCGAMGLERLQEGGRRAYVYAYVGDSAGGSVSERQEGRGRFNNELTCSRSYPWTSDRDLWRAGAPSSPRLASSLQPKAIFPKISERTLWALLGAAGGLLAARPGGLGARGPHLHSGRDTRPPEPTAARLRELSVPSDRNRSPRGGCGASILGGAAREMRLMRSGGRTASLVPSLSKFSLKTFTHLPSVYSVLWWQHPDGSIRWAPERGRGPSRLRRRFPSAA